MKLLILTSRFPYPLEKGDKLRAYHQIRMLARHHEVILVSLHDEEEVPTAHLQALEAFCSQIHLFQIDKRDSWTAALKSFISGKPAQVGYFFRQQIRQAIRGIIQKEKPDHLYCQLIRMSEYVRSLDVPSTLDYMDTFSVGMKRRAEKSPFYLRWPMRMESYRLMKYEAAIYPDFTHHTIISEQDRRYLRLPANSPVSIIPNGIDLDFFQPLPDQEPHHELVFVGNMGYFPNIEAAVFLAKSVMPLLWKQLPNARLLIAGARPSAEVKALAQDQRITVSGWVEDIREAYQDGQIFVAPLRAGSGQQNKILEAMALGRLCLTTPMVNNAIGAEPGKELLLAEGAQAFASQIRTALSQPRLCQAVAEAGQSFVRSHFSWEESTRKLEQLWDGGADS